MYFNNKDSWEDLGLIVKIDSIPQGNKRYETVNVPGRDGHLYIDEDFYDEDAKVEITIVNVDTVQDFKAINEWLYNITDNRLSLYKNGMCYHVKKVIHDDIEYEAKTVHKTKVTFLCEPFLFGFEKETIELNNNSNIYYSGTEQAETLFKINGTGNIQLTVNSNTMQISNVNEYVEIDSELMETRNRDCTSKDWDTIGDYNTLNTGINRISYTGNISKVTLEFYYRYRLGDGQDEQIN